MSRAYFEQLRAPVKGFDTFEQSAQSPMSEEPAKALRILRQDVPAATSRLADAAPVLAVQSAQRQSARPAWSQAPPRLLTARASA